MASLGSWVLILWGIGHLITIDILPLVFGIYLYDIDPKALDLMRDSGVGFPLSGQSNIYLLFYGMSVWFGVSLLGLGTLNLLMVHDPATRARRRLIYAVDIALTLTFLIIATVCFFSIPVLGGASALVFFLLAYLSA